MTRMHMIVRFVDIGRIDDHHCFITLLSKLRFSLRHRWP